MLFDQGNEQKAPKIDFEVVWTRIIVPVFDPHLFSSVIRLQPWISVEKAKWSLKSWKRSGSQRQSLSSCWGNRMVDLISSKENSYAFRSLEWYWWVSSDILLQDVVSCKRPLIAVKSDDDFERWRVKFLIFGLSIILLGTDLLSLL